MDLDVIIIGGGASGLACAVSLLKGAKKPNILVVEAADRAGKKLAATGNGQGNISNLDMTRAHFHGGNTALAERIACADPYDGSRLFDCLFTSDARGRIFPSGMQASALTDNLISVLKKAGTPVLYGARAEKIIKIPRGFKVYLSDGTSLTSRFAVLATGGKAAKQFKTDGTSYSLATGLGHTVTPLFPSLVQLKTQTEHIKRLKGIRADCRVTAYCGEEILATSRGDVIFTDYGVSGNAVFAVSAYVTDRQGVTLSLEFLPDISEKEILENIESRMRGGCAFSELLSGTLHNQIGRAVTERAGKSAKEVVRTLKNFTLPVKGTLGFDYAQVTRGGVDMREVTDDLESRLAENLFFAGEILDIDGDCGGYNLQWAFTGGMTVAAAILKRI